jgi:hypothetical protein
MCSFESASNYIIRPEFNDKSCLLFVVVMRDGWMLDLCCVLVRSFFNEKNNDNSPINSQGLFLCVIFLESC